MNALVVGASAGLGRALTDALGAQGFDLVLVARTEADLRRVAADAAARHGVRTVSVVADADSPLEFSTALRTALRGRSLDVAVFPMGLTVAEDVIGGDPKTAVDLVNVNLLSVMTASMEAAEVMRSQQSGSMIGFSSIAATRGRAKNAAYAAAKRGLESWFESLRADLSGIGVNVAWYVLGYVDTNLSYGQRLALPVASAERVASRVVREVDSVHGRRYEPTWWRFVAMVIRRLPHAIFTRLRT